MTHELKRYYSARRKGFACLGLLWAIVLSILAIGILFFHPTQVWQWIAALSLFSGSVFLTGMCFGTDITQRIFRKELAFNSDNKTKGETQ